MNSLINRYLTRHHNKNKLNTVTYLYLYLEPILTNELLEFDGLGKWVLNNEPKKKTVNKNNRTVTDRSQTSDQTKSRVWFQRVDDIQFCHNCAG